MTLQCYTWLLAFTSLLQILPVIVGWTCPPPRAAGSEINIIVTKRTYRHFGAMYRFQKQLPSSTGEWHPIPGGSGDSDEDVSSFKAYNRRIPPEYQGYGVTGVTRWLKCGGFERRVRVCRTRQRLMPHHMFEFQFDYLTTGNCHEDDRHMFDFYVADDARVYEQTRRFRAGKCDYDGNNYRPWVGVINYGCFSDSCVDVLGAFNFHALPGI